jgi:Fe-S-cluster containining protein
MIERESKCGDCCVCCTALIVYANSFFKTKPAGETCKYVANNQCSIYKDRPSVCKPYECFWLQLTKKVDGGSPIIWRPNNLGALVTPKPELEKDNKIPLCFNEIYKNAIDLNDPSPELKSFLDMIFTLEKKQKKRWEMYLIPFGSEGCGNKINVNWVS